VHVQGRPCYGLERPQLLLQVTLLALVVETRTPEVIIGIFAFLRCGNVAAILELDEQLNSEYKIFEAAPQESRGVPPKNPAPDYFL